MRKWISVTGFHLPGSIANPVADSGQPLFSLWLESPYESYASLNRQFRTLIAGSQMRGFTRQKGLGLLTLALVAAVLVGASSYCLLGVNADSDSELEIGEKFTVSGRGFAWTKSDGQILRSTSTIELEARITDLEVEETTLKEWYNGLPEQAKEKVIARLKGIATRIAEKWNLDPEEVLQKLLVRLAEKKIVVYKVSFEVKNGHITIGEERFPITSGTGTYVRVGRRYWAFKMALEASGQGGKKSINLAGCMSYAKGRIIGESLRYVLGYKLTIG